MGMLCLIRERGREKEGMQEILKEGYIPKDVYSRWCIYLL